jgi:predicted RNA-binding Zn ribbon-like protein
MTGEEPAVTVAGLADGVLTRERALPQPGGRDPAPGDLALLQSFVNTHFDLVDEWGADRLSTPERLARWLGDRGLLTQDSRLGRADLEHALGLREGLRELARANRDRSFRPDSALVERINQVAGRAPVALVTSARGVILTPRAETDLDAGLGVLLAIAGHAMIDGGWGRLKACPGDHCGWVFYDHSRNNSGRWCSMAVCGGRTKARAHYRRRRGRGPG